MVFRLIATGLNIPYELLMKDFSRTNYSSARAALIEAWRFFRARREWLVASFCDPVYEAWMDEAVASGMIIATGYFDDLQIRQAYLGTEWTGDGMGQLNPLDEINAAKERVALGVSNRSIEASEIGGRDWATVHAQLAREEDARLEAGLTPALYSTQGGQPTAPTGKKPTSQVDSTDDQEEKTP
jgi:capsid protein